MWRYFLLSGILLLAVCVKGQAVSRLSIGYNVGFDCSQKANNEEGSVDGACWHEETLEYKRKKTSFTTNRRTTLSLFFEWKGGFQPNSVRDSIFVKHLFRRRKLQAAALEEYLAAITRLYTDSVLNFDAADFSNNSLLIERCRDSSVTVFRYMTPDPERNVYSTVMPWVSVKFTMSGTEYALWHDAYNHFWELQYDIEGCKESYHFVDTKLDAFLAEAVPKRFGGSKIFRNRELEKDLKGWLELPEE